MPVTHTESVAEGPALHPLCSSLERWLSPTSPFHLIADRLDSSILQTADATLESSVWMGTIGCG
jgi:hypothetical protein